MAQLSTGAARKADKTQGSSKRSQTPGSPIMESFFAGQKYIGEPRILMIDIETSPVLGWSWGIYDTDLLEVVENTKILAVSYRWNHEKKTKVITLPMFKGYRPGIVNDRALCKRLWNILDEADCIVAHNGDRFDLRKINGRFFTHNIKPPRPYITLDTLKIARRYLGLDSNKMGDICKALGIGEKLATRGKATWFGCIRGEKQAWKEMAAYNIHDVDLLVEVYKRLLPWAMSKENRRRPITAKDYANNI